MSTKNLKKIVSALLIFAVLAGIGVALTPPPPPPPPVPQNIGIFDQPITKLQTNATDQAACRQCHQTSGTNISGGYNNTVGGVPTRHHRLVQTGVVNPYTNAPFGCNDCHPSTPGVGNGILLNRACTDCHNGTTFSASGARVGNFSRPHHVNTSYATSNIGNPAANRTCNFCHGSLVNNYNDGHYIPSYATDLFITPFASFKATSNVPNDVTGTGLHPGNKTWGGCYSCHEAHPENPEIEDLHDTHHISILGNRTGTVFQTMDTPFNLTGAPGGRACFVCHVTNLSNPGYYYRIPIPDQNGSGAIILAMELRNSSAAQNTVLEPGTTNITFNGTGCQKCHGASSLHNIQFQYVQNGPQGKGHINNNTDCEGCHAGYVPLSDVGFGAFIPSVNSVSPSVIVPGTATTLTIMGSSFVSGYDRTYTSVVTVDGVTYTPTSVIDTEILVDIPALTAGEHLLQIVKNGDKFSKLTTLTVAPNLQITSAKVNKGVITITGLNFGTKPANAQYYVSVKDASGNQIISQSITSWSNIQIKAKNSAAKKDLIVTVMTKDAGEVTATVT